MAKSQHTPEWRAMVALEYLNGQGSSLSIAVNIVLLTKPFVDEHNAIKNKELLRFHEDLIIPLYIRF